MPNDVRQPNQYEVQPTITVSDEIQERQVTTIEDVNKKIMYMLMGYSYVKTKESKGWFRDPKLPALINETGANSILPIINTYSNRALVLGKLDKITTEDINFDFADSIITLVGNNYIKFGIEKQNREVIVNTLTSYIRVVLTRVTDGLDRKWFDRINMDIDKKINETGIATGQPIEKMPFG